jgi:signal transduction histidine kinase
MGEREIVIFIVIANIILLVFIVGIIAFIFQFRKRKLLHNQEKDLISQTHSQQLLEKQLETQYQTMKVLGQEIHDNVGQKLTLASIYSQQIAHANQYPELSQKIETISKLLNESLQDLRQLSKSLVQPQLAQYDLLELLEQESLQINQTGVKLRVNTTLNTIDLDINQKNSLFRLLQEFIQNSLKHAHCKYVTVSITQIEQKMMISIEDDGIGFDGAIQKEGIGLSNMKRRAFEMNFDFYLESIPQKGTKLTLIKK